MSRRPLSPLVSLLPMVFVAVVACSGRSAPQTEPTSAAAPDTLVRAVRGGRVIIELGPRRPGEIMPFDTARLARASAVRTEPASLTMWVGDSIPSSMLRLIVLDREGSPLGYVSLRDSRLQPGAAALARGEAPVIVGRHAGESVLEVSLPRVYWRGRTESRPTARVRITVLAERLP